MEMLIERGLAEQRVDKVFNGVNYERQFGFFNPIKYGKIPITIIGAGAIGSFTCLNLAKVGFHDITVYDDDIVSEENIPNQFYPFDAIGKEKVFALQKFIGEFTGVDIKPVPEKFTEGEIGGGLVICAVDSMVSRLWVVDAFGKGIADSEVGMLGLIDGRMGGLVYRIYTCHPSQQSIQEYRKNWYPDSQAAIEKCTEKAIIFNVGEIAAKIAALSVRMVMGQEVPSEIIGDMVSFQTMVTESKANAAHAKEPTPADSKEVTNESAQQS